VLDAMSTKGYRRVFVEYERVIDVAGDPAPCSISVGDEWTHQVTHYLHSETMMTTGREDLMTSRAQFPPPAQCWLVFSIANAWRYILSHDKAKILVEYAAIRHAKVSKIVSPFELERALPSTAKSQHVAIWLQLDQGCIHSIMSVKM